MPFDFGPPDWEELLADRIAYWRERLMGDPTLKATIDFETRSPCDLLKRGGWVYSEDLDTEIMCLAWMLPDEELGADLWHMAHPRFDIEESPEEVLHELFAFIIAGGLIEAHNAFFERAIWTNIGVVRHRWPEIRHLQWRCSASRASMCSLPRSLDGAVNAMNLSLKKDMEGNRIMKKMSKPKKRPSKADKELCEAEGLNWKHEHIYHESLEDIHHLWSYCQLDVEGEHLLSEALPELPPSELQLWQIDQELNVRGVLIDEELARVALKLADHVREVMNAELCQLTDGVVERASQRQRVKDWLVEFEDLEVPDTTADTLDHYVEHEDISARARRILQIVREVNKTSTSKYEKMLLCMASDGRARDILMYHGAGTGRWSGKGIQVQNLPKGDLWNIDLAVQDIMEQDLDWVKICWGDPMEVLAGALRGALVPTPGRDFMVADYSAIEARCVLWLADDQPALEVFYAGEDIYCDMATGIYGYKVEKKTHKQERQFGKQAVLGLGYQMGWLKFFMTCRGYKISFGRDQVKGILRHHYPKYTDWVKKHLCLKKGVEYTKKQKAAARKTIRQLQEMREDPKLIIHELALMKYTVDVYRRRYKAVKQMWSDQERAAIRSVSDEHSFDDPVVCGKIKWYLSDEKELSTGEVVPAGKFLLCELPSGRTIYYCDPMIKPTVTSWGEKKLALRYMSVDSTTKRWVRTATYGGKLTENITQGVARDVMAHAMIQCAEEGVYDLIMTVHDEMVTEVDSDVGMDLVQVGEKEGKPIFRESGLIDFERLMGDKPAWAKGCPITAEAERMPRYRK